MTPQQKKEGKDVLNWLLENFETFSSIIKTKLDMGQLSVKDPQVQLAIRIIQGGLDRLKN